MVKDFAELKDENLIKAFKCLEGYGEPDPVNPEQKTLSFPQTLLLENGYPAVYLPILTRTGYLQRRADGVYIIPPPEGRTMSKKALKAPRAFKSSGRRLDHSEIIKRFKDLGVTYNGKRYLTRLTYVCEVVDVAPTIFFTLCRNGLLIPVIVDDELRTIFEKIKSPINAITKVIYQFPSQIDNGSTTVKAVETPSPPKPVGKPTYYVPKLQIHAVPQKLPPTIIIPAKALALEEIAIFVDLPNVLSNSPGSLRFLLNKILEISQQYGAVHYPLVFGDTSKQTLVGRQDIVGAGFIFIDCPSTISQDSGSTHESVDAIMTDTIYRTWEGSPSITMYILVTGDSDFVPIVNRLKFRKKKVLLMYPSSRIAANLKRIVDDVIVIEQSQLKKTLIELSEYFQDVPLLIEKSRGDKEKEFALKCLIETLNLFNNLLFLGKKVGITYIIDHTWNTQFKKDNRLTLPDCGDLVISLKEADILLKVEDPSVDAKYYTLDWNHPFVRYWLRKTPNGNL